MKDKVIKLEDGRYAVARWDEKGKYYVVSDAICGSGFAPDPQVAAAGCLNGPLTYATRGAAETAMREESL